MAAEPTYEPIATTTLGSATSAVTFSNISGSYTDLVLVDQAFGVASHYFVRLNSDSGSNYSVNVILAVSGSALADRSSNQTSGQISRSADSSNSPMGITHFMKYSATDSWKTILSKGNVGNSIVIQYVNLWRSTSAITSIELRPASGNFDTGSIFTLYGIKAA